MSTITGTQAGETLVGTSDADAIYGLGGDNTLVGGSGADTFWHLGVAAGNVQIAQISAANFVFL